MKENVEKRACSVVPPSYQQHPQQKQVQVAPVPPGIEVSLIDSSILNKKNNDLFQHRTLHQITFTLPLIMTRKNLALALIKMSDLAELESVVYLTHLLCLIRYHPCITRGGYCLLLR